MSDRRFWLNVLVLILIALVILGIEAACWWVWG